MRVVIALGGNAIQRPGEQGRFEEQLENVRGTSAQIVRMIEAGYQVTISHGNGPQVGAILLQNEHSRSVVPAMPLDVCVAQSQGLIGYMMQQSLRNNLSEHGVDIPVVTVVTQVLVEESDPAFQNPTKPVGPFYSQDEAERLAQTKGFAVRDDSGRGWRRVVPSPDPKAIVEADAIVPLMESGAIVVASGGGGIPVVKTASGYAGVEAVIDKDLAAERLAQTMRATMLLLLTDVNGVAINYGTAQERFLPSMTPGEARRYLEQGHFPAGSMGPKVQAAVRFVENGGQSCTIASLEKAWEALHGKAGTTITEQRNR